MSLPATPSLALLYPGDRAARERADPSESRFAALFAACADAGIRAEPAVYHDDFADDVAAQLRRVDAVLVWCNPIEGRAPSRPARCAVARGGRCRRVRQRAPGHDRALGHEGCAAGHARVAVRQRRAAHRFGSAAAHRVAAAFAARCARAEAASRPQRHRRVACRAGRRVGRSRALRHAQRGSAEEVVSFDTLAQTMAPYFEAEAGGHMIDQAWQPRLVDGMVRAYLVADRVVGFRASGGQCALSRKRG